MHYELAYTKITVNSGVDQGFPQSACGYFVVVDPTLHSIMAELCNLHDPGVSTIGTCGWSRIVSYRQLRLSQLQQVQSILPHRQQKHKSGKALAKTQFQSSSKKRSRSHSVVWEDIYKSMEILTPAQLFWVSRLPWRKLHNAFRKSLPHLRTSMLKVSLCKL